MQIYNVNYLTRQDEQREEIETESLETENDSEAFAEFTSSNGWDEYQIDNFSVTAIKQWVKDNFQQLCMENQKII